MERLIPQIPLPVGPFLGPMARATKPLVVGVAGGAINGRVPCAGPFALIDPMKEPYHDDRPLG